MKKQLETLISEALLTLKTQSILTDDLNPVIHVERTRDVAHGVERKSAPLTTFLLGFAAGKESLSKTEVTDLISKISHAVSEWENVE